MEGGDQSLLFQVYDLRFGSQYPESREFIAEIGLQGKKEYSKER